MGELRSQYSVDKEMPNMINPKSEILNPKQSGMTKNQNTKTVLNFEFGVLDLFRV